MCFCRKCYPTTRKGHQMDNAYTQDEYGKWVPSVPLPLYSQSWFGLRKRYVCMCGGEFRSEAAYEDHYRADHTEGTP